MILLSEVRNVLLWFVRRGAMNAAQAKAMCDDVAAVLGPRVVTVSSERVMDVALECGLTACDGRPDFGRLVPETRCGCGGGLLKSVANQSTKTLQICYHEYCNRVDQ